MKSQHSFSNVPSANIPRSSFNLSHGLKTTFDADDLVPILVADVIPGDTWNLKCNFFARLATPLHPIMDNLYLETFFFFVPYRIIWDNWEKMHGAQDNPADGIAYTVPTFTSVTAVGIGELHDYLGIPTGVTNALIGVSNLPQRAYLNIYHEWFRDQNLQDRIDWDTDNGPDAPITTLLRRCKRHDYFTSCLPWPQKGTASSFGMSGQPGINANTTDISDTIGYWDDDQAARRMFLPVTSTSIVAHPTTEPDAFLYANIGAVTISINEVRLAFQIQRLLERDARSGTRFVESLKAHWGVTSPDHRLQRPEFLGGGSSSINVTPVAQTSAQPTPAANDKLGELAGFGTVSGKHSFTQSFVEHGVLMGLANVRGDITYSQGIDRYWRKSTRYDFYYPVLSGIGEQSVDNGEIFADGTATDDAIFGYQERYAEYRFMPSRLTSLMRTGVTGSLEPWHLSEDYSSLPALGNTWIQANTSVPLDRAIAINTEPHFIADFYFDIKAARPLPLYGVPGNLDRL